MSAKKTTTNKRRAFTNIVDAYFHIKKNVEGLDEKTAILEACIPTGIKYNSSFYTRWKVRPQTDIVRYMQTVVTDFLIKQEFPDATEEQIKMLTSALAIPVSEDIIVSINKFLSNKNKSKKLLEDYAEEVRIEAQAQYQRKISRKAAAAKSE